MIKNVFIVLFLSLSLLQISCSSNSSGGEDLDISEIKKIESTGEFSEDEFFSDDELVAEGDEEQLIDVPGDDVAAIGEEGGDLEDVGSELDLEIVDDGEADLLADADLDIANEFEEGGADVSTDLAEDDGELNFDDLDIDDEGIDEGTTDVAKNSGADELLLEEDSTDFGEFDDTASVDPGPSGADNVTIDESEMDDLFASDIKEEEPTASDLLEGEEVQIAESDLTTSPQVNDTSNTSTGSSDEDFFNDQGSTEELTISNDFDDFDDEPVADQTASASDLLVGEDISVDSSFEDIESPKTSTANEGIASSTDGDFILDEQPVASSEPVVEEKKAFIPVKKMKTVPFVKNGILANSVYFVRSGDSLSGIANKVYGSGSAVDFTIVNPHLKPGALRVGQKVYYNSPRRPQDRARLITFYEDAGTPAQFYQASTGENIRTISRNLLGHSRSWMEVWATNQDIISKGNLDSDYSVRYWMGNDVSSPAVLASNKPAVSTPPPAPVAKDPRLSSSGRNSLEAEIEMDQRIESKNTPKVAINNDNELDDFEEEPISMDEPDFSEPDPVVTNTASNTPPPRPSASGRVNNNNGRSNQNNKSDFSNDDIGNEPDFSNDDLADSSADDFGSEPDRSNVGNPETPRKIAKRPSFPMMQKNGALSKSMIESLALGFGGLLLLLAVLLIVRKKRKRAEAIQMDSFDFGGETTIENEQTKTQIDI